MTHWVLDVLFEGDSGGKLALVNTLLKDAFPAGKLGVCRSACLVELFDPFVLGLTERELITHAELFSDVGMNVVDRTALERRLLRRTTHGNTPVVLGVAVGGHVELLGAHGVGKQDIAVFRGVSHERIATHDELALALIGEHLVDLVDVTMLVRNAVACIVPEHLDAILRLLDLGRSCRHFGILRAHEQCDLISCIEFLLEVFALVDALEPRIAADLGVHHVHWSAIRVFV